MEDVTCLDQLVTYVLLDGEAVLTETCIDPLTEADLLGRAARRGCWLAITVGGAFLGAAPSVKNKMNIWKNFSG